MVVRTVAKQAETLEDPKVTWASECLQQISLEWWADDCTRTKLPVMLCKLVSLASLEDTLNFVSSH